jgi:hypothetical protein
VIAARASRAHVLQLLHAVMHRPARAAAQAPASTRLAELLQAAGHLIHRRSSVFVVSDFISEPGWERPLAQLPCATRCWPCACSTRWSAPCPTWAC